MMVAQFSYTARKSSGELATGVLEANDAATVAQILAGRSFTPIEIKESDEELNSDSAQISFLTPNITLEDLVMFSRQMYSLVKSGIPILRAVKGLADTTASKRMSLALADVADQLERGRTLSSALNKHSEVFGRLFVSIVHVGENTGKLDEAFLQLSFYLEREQETRKQIKAATRYPMFVLIAIVIAMVIMNMVVIPIFADMFKSFGAELPLMTRILLATSDLGSLKNEAIAVSRELYAQAQPALASNIEQDVTNLNLNKSSTLKSVNGVVVSEQSKLVPRSKVKLGNFTELLKQRLINEYQKVGNQRIVSDAQVTLSVLDNTHFEENLVSRLGKLQTQCQNCGLNYKLGPKVLEGGALIQVLVADQEGQLVRHFKRGEVEERAIGVLSTIPAAVALSTLGNQPDTLFCNQAYRNLPSPTTELPKGLVNCDTLSKPGHSLSFQESIQARASLPLLYALRKQANAEQLQGLYRDFGFTDIRTKEGNASHGDQLAYEMSYGVVQSEPLHLLDMVHQLGDVLYGRSQSKAIIAISQFLVSDLEEGRRYLEFNKKSSAITISKNYLRTQEAKSSLRQLLTYDFNSKNGALKSLRNIENGRILLAKTGQSYTKQQTLRDHWLIASVLIRGRRYSVSAFVGSPTTDQKGLAKQLSAGALFRPIMAGIIDSLD